MKTSECSIIIHRNFDVGVGILYIRRKMKMLQEK